MSGGRYNHLYRADPGEIVDRRADLTAIRDRLVELDAGDIAIEIDEILGAIGDDREQTADRDRIARQLSKIGEVLQAVELLDSDDWDEKQAREVITRFRESHD